MPLRMYCERCGSPVLVKRMQEHRKEFVFEYDCAKCALTIRETIEKMEW